MSQPIIPPQMNKNKLIIKGFFTGWDLLSFIIFSALGGLTIWSLWDLNWILAFLIGIFQLMTMVSFLMPIGNKRIYHHIYLFWKHCFGFKKFESFKQTKLLIPYQKVIEDFIMTENEYLGAIKLHGFNLLNLSIDEQNIKISDLQRLFKLIETPISILKLEEPFSLNHGEKFIVNGLSKIKEETRKKQLNFYLKHFQDDGALSNQNLEKSFYLIVYAKSLIELKKWLGFCFEKLQNASLQPKTLNYYELVNILKQILNPYVEDFNKNTVDKFKDDLPKLLSYREAKFQADYLTVNNSFHLKFNALYELPVFPNRTWALPLMDSDGSVIININLLPKDIVRKKLSKSVANLSTNALTASKKDLVGHEELQHKLNIYRELITQLGTGEETFKKMNIFICNYGQNKKELLEKQKFLKEILVNNEIKSESLLFEQLEGYSAFIPKLNNPFISQFSLEIPTLALAESFPFLNNSLKDSRGLYLGNNMLGEPIILDQFKYSSEDKKRKNHNMMIIGQAGSGKTTLAKKILNFHIMLNRVLIIIDPEREYKSICQYYKGNWIDIGNATSGQINPLQILGTDDSKYSSKMKDISNHVQFLENWLSILFSDLKGNQLRYFSMMLVKFYSDWFENHTNVLNLKSNQYPILSDFLEYLKINHSNRFEHEMIFELINNEFIGNGKYAELYNHHSTLKNYNNLLTVFDIHTLYEKGHKPTINAQLYLLTSYIAHLVKFNDLNTKKELIILIDEAHLLIDSQKPIALDFIFQMTKRIRKRKGGLILVTQNPDDFLGTEEIQKKTMAIINNVQYSFIMNLSPKNLEDVNQMYKSFGGLSEPQKNFIAHAKTGDALLINGGFERHEVNVRVFDSELKAFNYQKGKYVKKS